MKTKSPILRTFAQKMKRLRLEKGWTQEELALKADLHRAYIGQIERGEKNIGLRNLEKIAKALGVKITLIRIATYK
jgi:transcriptional regulator with XRE-family HTH domain